jgi:hypothetical protein
MIGNDLLMMTRIRLAAFVAGLALVVMATPVLAGTVSIGANFTGSTSGSSGFFPPDTMGAVGPNHVVELINGRYAVYSKSGTLATSSSLDSFWSNAGVTPAGGFTFDPRIVYDSGSGRFFATAVDNAGGANNLLVAVSDSSDPSAGWSGHAIDSDSSNLRWADFPTIGYDTDAVYVAANMFSISSSSPVTTKTDILVLPKADLIAATSSVANRTLFEGVSGGNTGFSIQPAIDFDGGGLPNVLLSASSAAAGYLDVSTITGTAASPTLSHSLTDVSISSAASPPNADQKGSTIDIETNDSRFSGNVILQGGDLWGVHAVNVSGRAAVRWYRIDPSTLIVLEWGVISDSELAFFFPSIAVNEYGDVVIGFSGSGPDDYVSSFAVVGQLSGGTTTFDAPLLLKAGTASYEKIFSGRNRWGDYSATVFDPVNPTHFWTFQEWAGSSANTWSTQITEIVVRAPSGVVPLPSAALMGLGLLALLGSVGRLRRRR